jgi:tetratricopeptide (TPR) repeat protein
MQDILVDAIIKRVAAFEERNQRDEVFAEYQRGLAAVPDSAALHNAVGVFLFHEKKFDDAAHHLRTAIALDDDVLAAKLNLALLLDTQGKYDEAMAMFRRGALLDPVGYASQSVIIGKALEQPVAADPHADVGVHALISHLYALSYLYAIKTFLRFSGIRAAVVVYNDGSLDANDLAALTEQVQGIQIVDINNQDFHELAGYPLCQRFAGDHMFARRLFAIARYAKASKLILMDSDVLFLRPPTEIQAWARAEDAPSLFNQDSREASSFFYQNSEAPEFQCPSYFNAGLICTRPDRIDYGVVEGMLGRLYSASSQPLMWIWDQSIWSVLVGRGPHEALPAHTYSFVNSADSIRARADVSQITTRHYSFPKQLFWVEGVSYLINSGLI